jgi:hypothetical protein
MRLLAGPQLGIESQAFDHCDSPAGQVKLARCWTTAATPIFVKNARVCRQTRAKRCGGPPCHRVGWEQEGEVASPVRAPARRCKGS